MNLNKKKKKRKQGRDGSPGCFWMPVTSESMEATQHFWSSPFSWTEVRRKFGVLVPEMINWAVSTQTAHQNVSFCSQSWCGKSPWQPLSAEASLIRIFAVLSSCTLNFYALNLPIDERFGYKVWHRFSHTFHAGREWTTAEIVEKTSKKIIQKLL